MPEPNSNNADPNLSQPPNLSDGALNVLKEIGIDVSQADKDVIELAESVAKQNTGDSGAPPKKKYADQYESVEDLERSYKEILAEKTRVDQRFKPFDPLLKIMEDNPEFGQYVIDQAQGFLKTRTLPTAGPAKKEGDLDFLGNTNDTPTMEQIRQLVSEATAKAVAQSRTETGRAFEAMSMVNDFKGKHTDLKDSELAQVLLTSRKAGLDMEAAYRAVLPDKYELEMKQRLLKGQPARQTFTPSSPSEEEVGNGGTNNRLSTSLLKVIADDPKQLDKLPPAQREAILNQIAMDVIGISPETF